MKRILGYLIPKLSMMSLQLFIKLMSTVAELLLPWMLSKIIDDCVPEHNMSGIALWGGLMVVCAAIGLMGNITANRMATRISRDTTKKIRHDLFQKTSLLSSAQVDGFTTSSLISRLTSDTYNVHQMIDRMQRLGVRAPIMLLGGMLITFSLEPVLTLVLVGILPLLALVVWYVSKHSIPLYTKTQGTLDALVRKVQENMAGVRVIKALSKVDYERERFDERNRALAENERKAGVLSAVTNPVMNLLLNLGLTLTIVAGAYRVNLGVTLPGKIIAFMSYFTMILNALLMVSRLFVLYSKGAASAKRICEIMDAPLDMPLMALQGEDTTDHIAFEDVSFSYNKNVENLAHVSFRLQKGQTLGVIGPTGSGKSTLISILMRLYDVDSGRVLLDGQDVRSIRPELLYSRFGVVYQNDFLYADTLLENIDFGRGLDKEQIIKAAKDAQADFIAEKPEGFLTLLTQKGANLSGGQKQRVLIARALAANPDILILDDCSSALDYKTDAQLRHALKNEYADTTTVIVAQRVSAIMGADLILVMDEGRVIGSGTHAQLMETCQSYREIAMIQMGEVA